MDDLRGRAAVVTGGASGIGRAMAEAFLAEGMAVVLADIEAPRLEETAAALGGRGGRVVAVRCDVSRGEEVEALAERAWAELGRVDVLCNNAGVASGGPVWLHTTADWEWLLGVNLWGVIHGIRVFVPRMLAQGGEGHIVNTASMAGLITGPFLGMYNVSKQGVVALSETLHKDLALTGAPLHVSVLCPGFVRTAIADADRNRPGAAAGGATGHPLQDLARAAVAGGIDPAIVGKAVVDAIRTRRFYVFTHPDLLAAFRERATDILEGRTPATTVQFV